MGGIWQGAPCMGNAMRKVLVALLLFAARSLAQVQPVTLHVEAEDFSLAIPPCTKLASVTFPSGCVQITGDTAAPAVPSIACPTATCKVILAAGMTLDYPVVVPVAGTYSLTVRLNGSETVEFQYPAGSMFGSGPIINNGLNTATAPLLLTLPQGPITIRMFVKSVGSGFPSSNWFNLTLVTPATTVNASINWCVKCDGSDKTPAAGSVRVNQIQGGTPVALKTYPLDNTGSFTGTIAVDTSQGDNVTLQVILQDGNGVETARAEQTFSMAMFAGVAKVVGSLTLQQTTNGVKVVGGSLATQ